MIEMRCLKNVVFFSNLFHNGSVYDYHLIINQLAKEFKGQLEWLGENIEKCITFSVPIKKKIWLQRDSNPQPLSL